MLSRGRLEPTAVSRVGADSANRVGTEIDGGTAKLWPSDHAGVTATFEVTATPTQAPTITEPTPTSTSTTTETTAV